MVGPVVLRVVGDAYTDGARINTIIWTGATTAGDVARVHARTKTGEGIGNLLWECRTDATNTYLGLNGGPSGIHAPHGFVLTALPAGTVLVYLRED